MCLSCSINTFQRGSTVRAAAAESSGRADIKGSLPLCCTLPVQPSWPVLPKAAKCLSLGSCKPLSLHPQGPAPAESPSAPHQTQTEFGTYSTRAASGARRVGRGIASAFFTIFLGVFFLLLLFWFFLVGWLVKSHCY